MALMAVGGQDVTREDVAEQVERIVSSAVFSHSESLSRLLRYLGQHATGPSASPLKEHQIAAEVFSRAASFDPRQDSTVRVQTGRLRSKLGEYYSGPGSGDALVIEIPKGAYAVSIHARAPEAPAPAAAPETAPGAAPARNLVPVVWALALSLAGMAGILTAVLLHDRPGPAPVSAGRDGGTAVLARFWAPFLDGQNPPLVVFGNAGGADAAAVHALDLVFFQLGRQFPVKRAHLLTAGDVRQSGIIFVGPPWENLSPRELPLMEQFAFERSEDTDRRGTPSLVNVHPNPGEPGRWPAAAANPAAEDYAVVALLPGAGPSHWTLYLAGLTPLGTEAAAEFVCRPASVGPLLQRLGGGTVRPFEAVLRVNVAAGVPVATEIAAFRARAR